MGLTETLRRYFAASALIARSAGKFDLANVWEERAAGHDHVGTSLFSGTDPIQPGPVSFDAALAALNMMLTGSGLDEAARPPFDGAKP